MRASTKALSLGAATALVALAVVTALLWARSAAAHEARTVIYLSVDDPHSDTNESVAPLSDGQLRACAAAARKPALAADVVDRLGLETATDELADRITVERVPETTLLEISVRDDSDTRALLIADTYAAAVLRAINSSEGGCGEGAGMTRTLATVTDPARLTD